MTLRVISGTARGRKLKSVPGDTTRPVMDRVKEALFNILADDVIDSNWWDLFGGTGAIGIEAESWSSPLNVNGIPLACEGAAPFVWSLVLTPDLKTAKSSSAGQCH